MLIFLIGGALLAGGPTRTPPPFEAARLAMRSFSVEDGIPNPRVHSLFLDSRGQLWAGTQEGVATYGGRGWTALAFPGSAPSTYVRAIAETAEGTMWFGTQDGGLWRWRAGAWRHFAGGRELPSHRINALCVTRGPGGEVLWIGTAGGGLLRMEGDRVSRVEAVQESDIWCMAEAENGHGKELWVGGDKGIWVQDASAWTRLDPKVSGWQGASNAIASCRDGRGRMEVWISAWGQGVGRWDPSSRQFLGFDPSFASRNPTSLAVSGPATGAQELWVGTFDEGILHRTASGWEPLGPAQGIPSTGIYALQVNPDGKPLLWAGTRGAGLVAIDPGGWRSLDKGSGLPSSHGNCFLEVDLSGRKELWIGTDAGLVRWTANGIQVDGLAQGLPSDYITDLIRIETPTGPAFYAGTLQGLARRANGRWVRVSEAEGLPFQRILTLRVDRDPDGSQALLVGADGGLGRLSHGAWTLLTPSQSRTVHAVLPDTRPDGVHSLWVGTRGGGLARWEEGRWTAFGPKEGLPNLSVYGLALSRSADGRRWLWAAMVGGGGLARVDLDHPERGFQAWNTTTLPGLPSNTIQRIEVRGDREMWLLTPRGIVRLELSGPEGLPGRVLTYTQADGLPSAAANVGALAFDSLGRVWVGTTQGMAVLDPARELASPPPPLPLLERVLVQDREVDGRGGLVLGHRDGRLSIQFVLPIYHRREDVRFQTQLLGLETEPTPWEEAASRDFTTLPPRAYVLRVYARDGLGRISGPLDIPFRVKPAPWATWWARTLFLLGGVGLVLVLLRLRTRVLQERARSLEAVVQARTRELAAANERLRELSLTDPLTGLNNRRFLEMAIQENVSRALRHLRHGAGVVPHDVILLLIDLDHFKRVNDTHGHQAGDRVLQQMGGILKELVRTVDRVVRWGGEEFLVAAVDVDVREAPLLAERIRERVANHPFDIGKDTPLAVTCSIGFACFPLHGGQPDVLTWEQVLMLADQCLYLVKASGRNGWSGLLPILPPPPVTLDPLPVDREYLLAEGLVQAVHSPA